eukprot:2384986-Pyramimonas_sp.AAC.1
MSPPAPPTLLPWVTENLEKAEAEAESNPEMQSAKLAAERLQDMTHSMNPAEEAALVKQVIGCCFHVTPSDWLLLSCVANWLAAVAM